MIISISGKKQKGKDTVGKIIQILTNFPKLNNEQVLEFLNKETENNNFKIVKFADSLKDMVCILLGCTRDKLEEESYKNSELGEEWWYYTRSFYGNIAQDLIPYSKDFTHKDLDKMSLIKLSPRLLLQLLGTECGRNILHPNIWVNALMSKYKEVVPKGAKPAVGYTCFDFPNWIITDVRFPNEINAVIKRKGLCIRVESYTLGIDNEDNHISETALDDFVGFDYIINNNGTLPELIHRVRKILQAEKIIEWTNKKQ